MFYEDNPNNEIISDRPWQYAALHNSLGTGPGEVALETVPRSNLLVTRQNRVSPNVFVPTAPIAAPVSYIEPQYNYRPLPSPSQSSTTKGNMQTKNVIVKEG
jgi:hypothetical protein